MSLDERLRRRVATHVNGKAAYWPEAEYPASPVLRWRVREFGTAREVFVYAPDEETALQRSGMSGPVSVALAPLEDEVVTMVDGRAAPGG